VVIKSAADGVATGAQRGGARAQCVRRKKRRSGRKRPRRRNVTNPSTRRAGGRRVQRQRHGATSDHGASAVAAVAAAPATARATHAGAARGGRPARPRRSGAPRHPTTARRLQAVPVSGRRREETVGVGVAAAAPRARPSGGGGGGGCRPPSAPHAPRRPCDCQWRGAALGSRPTARDARAATDQECQRWPQQRNSSPARAARWDAARGVTPVGLVRSPLAWRQLIGWH